MGLKLLSASQSRNAGHKINLKRMMRYVILFLIAGLFLTVGRLFRQLTLSIAFRGDDESVKSTFFPTSSSSVGMGGDVKRTRKTMRTEEGEKHASRVFRDEKQRIDITEGREEEETKTRTTVRRHKLDEHETAKKILRAIDSRLADRLYPPSYSTPTPSTQHEHDGNHRQRNSLSWWSLTSRSMWKSDEEYASKWKTFRDDFDEEKLGSSGGDSGGGFDDWSESKHENEKGHVIDYEINRKRIGIVHCFNSKDDEIISATSQGVDLCETYESEKDDDAYFDALYAQFRFWDVNTIVVVVDVSSTTSDTIEIHNSAMKLKEKSSKEGKIAIEVVSSLEESREALFARMRRAKAVALAGYDVSPVSFLAGVSRYDGHFIAPFLGISTMYGSGDSTRKDPRVTTSAANWKQAVMFTQRVHWRQHYPLLEKNDFVVPEENARTSATQPKDESTRTCEDLWGWRGLQNRWELKRSDAQTMQITASRSNRHPTARGFISMEAKLNALPLRNVAIDVSPHRDAMSKNPWHRLTALYATFVAKSRFFPNRDATSVTLLLPCQNPEDIPSEYAVLGKSRCKRSSDAIQFDSVVKIANDGLLWDLAWDGSLPCRDESLFKSFVNLLAGGGGEIFSKPKVPFTDRPICFMRRLNTSVRRLVNEEGVLQMLRDTFPANEVQLLNIQASDGIEKTRASMQKCGIFLGAHGAGMINEIYTLKDSIIFEMVPDNRPAYYRNCAVLRGLKYVDFGIRGTTETKSVTVDVSTLRDALRSIMRSTAKFQ